MKSDLAKIPYIVHKKFVYEAYRREMRWKWLFIGTNILWAVGAVLALLLG